MWNVFGSHASKYGYFPRNHWDCSGYPPIADNGVVSVSNPQMLYQLRGNQLIQDEYEAYYREHATLPHVPITTVPKAMYKVFSDIEQRWVSVNTKPGDETRAIESNINVTFTMPKAMTGPSEVTTESDASDVETTDNDDAVSRLIHRSRQYFDRLQQHLHNVESNSTDAQARHRGRTVPMKTKPMKVFRGSNP